jgi:hypothetical protein
MISASDRMMSRGIGSDETPENEAWEISSPIPGMRIINTWQIYNKIWIVLAVAEDNHYNIFRSINLQKYSLVHEHESRIYGMFWIDDGHMIFCAADGWFGTTNSGLDWSDIGELIWVEVPAVEVPEYETWAEVLDLAGDPDLDEVVPEFDNWNELMGVPIARAVAVVQTGEHAWNLVAYGQDRKIHLIDYPGGEWDEVYDSTYTEKWYPAIAGGPVGLLAGAGNKLLRSLDAGHNWQEIHTVQGITKSIVVSNQSNLPVFLIDVEQADGETSRLYWSYDLGDSLVHDMSRIGAVASVQSVTPTGSGEVQTAFAVVGQRAAGGSVAVRLLEA